MAVWTAFQSAATTCRCGRRRTISRFLHDLAERAVVRQRVRECPWRTARSGSRSTRAKPKGASAGDPFNCWNRPGTNRTGTRRAARGRWRPIRFGGVDRIGCRQYDADDCAEGRPVAGTRTRAETAGAEAVVRIAATQHATEDENPRRNMVIQSHRKQFDKSGKPAARRERSLKESEIAGFAARVAAGHQLAQGGEQLTSPRY